MLKIPASIPGESNSKQGKETVDENTYETHRDDIEVGLDVDCSIHNSVIATSPIEKYSLVYKNKEEVTAFQPNDKRKREASKRSSSQKKLQQMSSKSSISNKNNQGNVLGKSPSVGF